MFIQVLKNLDIKGKRVLIREDLNVPLENGKITSDARIRSALPTIQYAVHQGAQVIVMSHLGRPREGLAIVDQPKASLAPVAERITKISGLSVELVANYIDGFQFPRADITLLENVRINVGEKDNDEVLSKKLADLADIYVMDAFGTAHRAQASTEGVARYAPIACAGPLLVSELEALGSALANPKRPLVAIVGGSKISSKLKLLSNLVNKVDSLIVGGGIANTFLAASGVDVGSSRYETNLFDTARDLLQRINIPLPSDVVVAKSISSSANATVKSVHKVAADEMILDIGPESRREISELLLSAKTILWNGPVGVAEVPQFAEGTKALSLSIASSDAFSLAGGGDTLAAIELFGVEDGISYISTGGGAFLEFIEGKKLPAVAALEARFLKNEMRHSLH